MENSMAVPPEIKNRTIVWVSNSTSGYIPRRTETRSSAVSVNHVHSSISYNSPKVEATQVNIGRQRMSQVWCIRIRKYYSILKRKENLTHVTTSMNLEDMLSNISQSQKDKYHRTGLIWGTYLGSQIHRQSRMAGARGWGKRDGE